MDRHPDWAAEEARLADTLDRIGGEYEFVRRLYVEQEAGTAELRVAAAGSYSNDLFVAEKLFAITARVRKNLAHALMKPYFARVDFTPDGKPAMVCYIGKWGVGDHATRMPVVVDWRSAAANLYYSGQVGRAFYPSPEGPIHGDLTRKRIYGIEGGRLRSIVEADIITQDEYLNSVLSDHADARLRDIVTTIQTEQNAILRHDPRRPMVVQGAAGAGKTTVALHRIMWLLYAFQDTMSPANLMVLAPSPLFLSYISDVLPELGADDVIQTTYQGLCERLCGRTLPPAGDISALTALLDPDIPAEDKLRIAEMARFKGSLRFKECLLAYIGALALRMLPGGDLSIGKTAVCGREEAAGIFTGNLSPFPLARRDRELRKILGERMAKASRGLEENTEEETRRRANLLRTAIPSNSPERQRRMARLYEARDRRIEEIRRRAGESLSGYFKGWAKLDLLERYREFLSEEPLFPLPGSVDPALWRETCRQSRRALDAGRLDVGDLPGLIVLQQALFGHADRPDIHHTVLDEAQDYSPFMFDTLMSVCRNASFTIVGDLAQGIHEYRGVSDWNETGRVFGPAGFDRFELVTSYRSTVEIMELAGRVASRHPYPGYRPARPVLRHGAPPRIAQREGWDAADIAREMLVMKVRGAKTVAVVEKLPRQAETLYRILTESGIPARLLRDGDASYLGGMMVLPAHLCKGLEFDAVIMADAGRDEWPDDALHARLLYVCLTRPLHHLTVFYRNMPSRLLGMFPGEDGPPKGDREVDTN